MKPFVVGAAVVIFAGALAAYYYSQQTQPNPDPVEVTAPPSTIAQPEPMVRHVVKVPDANFRSHRWVRAIVLCLTPWPA